jgi:L-arabinose isomerase
MNVDLAAAKPVLREKAWSYTDAQAPVVATAAFRPGPVTFVDLAPGPNDTSTLIAAPGAMVLEGSDEKLAGAVRGWLKPRMALADFLAEYSRAGGTHHAALVYGHVARQMASLAQFMGWRSVTVDD